MATVLKLTRLSSKVLCTYNTSAYTPLRFAHNPYLPWHHLWQPGPYPKTEEERRKAADKYNLHPAEYELYPEDDDRAVGDYPKLPEISLDGKDPYYPYDFPDQRKNIGEPFHEYADIMFEERGVHSVPSRINRHKACMTFLYVMSGILIAYYLLEGVPVFRPVMEKQYPKPGVTHYTFEPLKK